MDKEKFEVTGLLERLFALYDSLILRVRMLDPSTHAGAQHFCEMVSQRALDLRAKIGLVVGCGEGHEAAYISHALSADVVGIDVHLAPSEAWTGDFDPVVASALQLPFSDNHFSFVFYHHVIEHVLNPRASLAEIERVLRPEGVRYIATPNRHRLVGYLGSYTATPRQKIKWNLTDYTARLRGQFRNELGAHAGFSRKELEAMLQDYFPEIEWLTRDYLRFKYAGRLPRLVLESLIRDPVVEFTVPAIYALCTK